MSYHRPPVDRRRPGAPGHLLRLRLRLLLLVSLVLPAVVLTAPAATAHEDLVASEPAQSSLVEVMPSRATLTFSGEVLDVHEITLVGPDGSVTNGDPTFSGSEVRQNLWAGPAGEYVMRYDVVSADGHEIAGEVAFEVGDLSAPAGGTTGGTTGTTAADQPGSDAAPPAPPGPSGWERIGDGAVPALVVLLGAAVALVLVRRRTGGRRA